MAADAITDDTFDATITESGVPVVVDFWAEWCGPCKQMAPHLEAVAEEMSDTVKVVKINVDENPVAASKYGVRGLPTLMLFKDGKMTSFETGSKSKQRIVEWLKESI